MFPEWMPPNRFALIDFWPAMEKAMMNDINPGHLMISVIDNLLKDEKIEGILIMMFCSRQFRNFTNYKYVIENINHSYKPIFFWLIGEIKEVEKVTKQMAEKNIPVFPNLEEMVKNFWILIQDSKNKKI